MEERDSAVSALFVVVYGDRSDMRHENLSFWIFLYLFGGMIMGKKRGEGRGAPKQQAMRRYRWYRAPRGRGTTLIISIIPCAKRL